MVTSGCEHLLGEELAALAQAGRVVGEERAIDEVRQLLLARDPLRQDALAGQVLVPVRALLLLQPLRRLRQVLAVTALALLHRAPLRALRGRARRVIVSAVGRSPKRGRLCYDRRRMTSAREKAEPTPAELGFSMPAEWEPHEATWLGWPHNPTDWPGKLDTIRWVYGEIVRKIAPGEEVRILVDSRAEERLARRRLAMAGADLAARAVRPAPDQPRLDARQRTDLRAPALRPPLRDGDRALPLQRLGQVPRLAEGPARPGDGGPPAREAAVPRARRPARLRPRGRRHRRERPRHAAHHRGVLPRPEGSRCATPAWAARASRRRCRRSSA